MAGLHAVLGLSLSLREEARAHSVGVSVACPGLISTGIFQAARDDALIVFPRSSRALALCARVAPSLLRWAVGRTMKPPS